MAYSIKKHEVDRLLNVLVVLGWELMEEMHFADTIELRIKKKLSPELLKAAGEVQMPSSPQ
jgi:uncharacterized protein YpiB (UPF0302 family)